MKKFILTILALVLSFGVASAETILNPDSIVIDDGQLKSVVFLPDVTGATDDDTFPNDEWAREDCFQTANSLPDTNPWKQSELDRCENSIFNLQPDGWVTREDSPYWNAKVADLGQIALHNDKRANTVAFYPNYDPANEYGREWSELSSYKKMVQHMMKQSSVKNLGKRVTVSFETEVEAGEFGAYKDAVLDFQGFDSSDIAIFQDGKIEFNTKYLTGNIQAGAVHQNSVPRQIILDIFVGVGDLDAYEKFINDLEAWNNSGTVLSEFDVNGNRTFIRE